MTQIDLFGKELCDSSGNPICNNNIFVYHDESGLFGGNSDWVYTGLLWLSHAKIEELYQDLISVRAKEQYNGEIHFKKLDKSFDKPSNQKERVAKDWLNLWLNRWSTKSWFNVLAVNTKHKNYDGRRFTEKYHSYNRFTAMAFKTGLSWFFQDYSQIQLKIYSDEKSREEQDNFNEYILRMILTYSGDSRKIPDISFDDEPLLCENCPKHGPYNKNQELLQLTDLLLGSVVSATEQKSMYKTKTWFGARMATILDDIRKKPWEQKYMLHKKFSITYFPDDQGFCYNNGPIKVNESTLENKSLSDFMS